MYIISSIIKGRIHKEVGLGTPFDAEYNVKRNKIIRNREISNMESTVKKGEATTIPAAKLSKEELEAQLEGFGVKELCMRAARGCCGSARAHFIIS